MDEKKVVEIDSGSYFIPALVAVGFMLLMGALSLLLCRLYYCFTMDIFKPWLTILKEFSTYELPWMAGLSVVGLVLMQTKRIVCFDPEKRSCFKGAKFFCFRKGKWQPLVLDDCRFIAFQKYDKNIDYTFGGLINRHVEEHVYDLRFVKRDNSFESLVSASSFRAVAEMVKLGQLLSKVYGLPFCDYVKQSLMKKKVLDFTDGENWPTV